MSLRPVAELLYAIAWAFLVHPTYWLIGTRSTHGYRNSRRRRNARGLGHRHIRIRGARLDSFTAQRRCVPHHLSDRRARNTRRGYDDQEAVSATLFDTEIASVTACP